jgi:hypothetical protein
MKCEPWQSWEEDFLREVADTMPSHEIADKLERTSSSIKCKASRLGVPLRHNVEIRKWTTGETALLAHMSSEEIAKVTDRSIYSVRSKRYHHRLQSNEVRSNDTRT